MGGAHEILGGGQCYLREECRPCGQSDITHSHTNRAVPRAPDLLQYEDDTFISSVTKVTQI